MSDYIAEVWPPAPTHGMITGNISRGIRVTHVPTGIQVTCDKHRQPHRNKDECIAMIKAAIAAAQEQK